MWYIVRLDSSRVATRHSSPTPHFDQGCDSSRVKLNYIPHILYIVVYEARQRAAFSIPVKSVSFKSFDYRRHRACAIAQLVVQLEHIIFIPNAATGSHNSWDIAVIVRLMHGEMHTTVSIELTMKEIHDSCDNQNALYNHFTKFNCGILFCLTKKYMIIERRNMYSTYRPIRGEHPNSKNSRPISGLYMCMDIQNLNLTPSED